MKHNVLLMSLLMSSSVFLTACGQEGTTLAIQSGSDVTDKQDHETGQNTGQDTGSAVDTSTETETGNGNIDSNTDTDTNTGTDTNTDTDTNTGTGTGTNTDSTGGNGSSTDSDSSTDSNTDNTNTNPNTLVIAQLQSPAPGSELNTNSITITPSHTSANTWLDVGTTKGGEDIFNGSIKGAVDVNNIPLNGQTVYVTLWSEINGQWQKQQYTLKTIKQNTDTGTNPDMGSDTDTGMGMGTDTGGTANNSFNQAPLALNGAFVLLAGESINGQVSADDIEQDILTYELLNQPQSGAITFNNANGQFSYSAGNSANNNSDSFSFRAFDGEHYSNTATVTLRYSQHAGVTLQGRGDGIGADLVIIGDGFTQNQMSKFHQAVDDYVDFMFEYEPEFKDHKKAWNIHRIDLISQESGADNSNGSNTVNTALDGYFNCGNIDRLLCVDSPKTFAAVNQAFPQWDNILVIVNSSKYGGAGYSNGIGTVSLSSSAKDVGLHEMAHTFAGLADEYTYGGSNAPTREPGSANSTINNDINSVKWKHWLGTGSGDGTIGLFEGAQYTSTGVWRPSNNSIMRSLGNAFHAVNKEAWTLAVYEHGGVYHSKMPVSSQVSQQSGDNTQFKVETVMDAGAQSLRWYINDLEQTSLNDESQVSLGNNQNNNFTVRVDISDKTGNIRKDDDGFSSDSISWEVTVQ